MKLKALTALAVTLFLTNCASPTGEAACPVLVSYTQSERDAAASALEALGANHILYRMVEDYGALRAQVRALGC